MSVADLMVRVLDAHIFFGAHPNDRRTTGTLHRPERRRGPRQRALPESCAGRFHSGARAERPPRPMGGPGSKMHEIQNVVRRPLPSRVWPLTASGT